MLPVHYLQFTLRRFATRVIVALFLVVSAAVLSSSATPRQDAIKFNDAGVLALNKGDFQTAIANLKLALDADSSYQLAAENLAIAYNNYGLSLTSKPLEALAQFHRALFYQSDNPTTKANMDGVIGLMNKNPGSFDARVALGDQALEQHDYIGAFIEYKQALAIKDDPEVTRKLKTIAAMPELSRAFSPVSTGGSTADLDSAQLHSTLKEISKANALVHAGKMAEAKEIYDQALAKVGAQNKIASVVYCLRGLAYLSQEDAGKALDDFDSAIKVIAVGETQLPSIKKTAPNLGSLLVTSYNGRYMSCYWLGKYSQAAQSQDMLNLLVPEKAGEGHISNALLYMVADQGKQVQNELDKAMALDPKLKPDAEKFSGMWKALEVLTPEQRKGATTIFVQAFKTTVKPVSAELTKSLEAISAAHPSSEQRQPVRKDQKPVDQQVELAEEALKDDPTSPQAHIELGKAFQARGARAQAEAEFRQALFFDKDNATAKQLLDSLHQKK